jgi:putative tryptophan/tyrosine transport system substrate-binding protein
MKRREFITLLGGTALAWPFGARAQQPVKPMIGFLGSAPLDGLAPYLPAFLQGIRETGLVEGRNVTIDYSWADNDNDRLQALAVELINRQTTVITAPSIAAALAAKSATSTIPIVFYTGADPVALGLVASLNRPSGNLTGITGLGNVLERKRLELLHDLIPTASSFALLVNGANPILAETTTRDVQAASRTLGLQLHVLHASTEREIDAVFAKLAELQAGGLVIGADNYFNSRSEQLATLAFRHRVPAIYQYHKFATAGGVMSYGGSFTDAYRLLGVYTGRIIKGEKPTDLPVQQSTKVELILNLKIAKALGVAIPTAILVRADEVIE